MASTTHVGLLVRDHHTETGSKSTWAGEPHARNPCSSSGPPILQTGKQWRGQARSPARGPSGTTGLRCSRKETTFSTRGDLLIPLMRGGLIPVLSCRKGTSNFPLGLEKPGTGSSHTLFKTMRITPSRAADQHRRAKHSQGNTHLTRGGQEEAKDGSQSPEL